MRIHRKVGRLPAVMATAILAVGMLAAVPASTQTAIARAAPAEAGCNPSDNAVPEWRTITSGPGVTLCQGLSTFGFDDAYVQIVDLSAGAKVRLISEHCEECPFSDKTRSTDAQFHKRTASEWYDWIQSNEDTPSPSRLFSTSNASFFTDTSNDTSPISLPMYHHVATIDGDVFLDGTHGWAYATGTDGDPGNDDPAWGSPKLAISFGDALSPLQKVEMLTFPMHYTDAEVNSLAGINPLNFERLQGDSTVGFTPDFDGGTGSNRRTYVGVDSNIASKVYILNTNENFTVGEATTILESFGAAAEIQLDGGGSTQMTADWDQDGDVNELVESDVIPDRTVPNTLAVYFAS
jgi:Phosphodiester glycosidase